MYLLNLLIEAVAARGWGRLLYNILFVAGFVAIFIFNHFHCKHYHISRGKAQLMLVCTYLVSALWMFFQCWVENGFKGWGGNNIVRTFVWVPVVALLFSKLFKVKWFQACDLFAPCVPLIQAVSHWGCIFVGCCHGYPCSWGIINPAYNVKMFPIQPLEAIVALLVVITVCLYEKRHDYAVDGLAYPLMLMLFGYSRFLLEFLRNNSKLLFGLSALSLHALFMALVGTVAFVAVKEHNKGKIAAAKSRREGR